MQILCVRRNFLRRLYEGALRGAYVFNGCSPGKTLGGHETTGVKPPYSTAFVDRMPGQLVSEGNRLTRALLGIRVALALFAKPAGHQCQVALPWGEPAPVFYRCCIAPNTAIKQQ